MSDQGDLTYLNLIGLAGYLAWASGEQKLKRKATPSRLAARPIIVLRREKRKKKMSANGREM